jgi:hypothetical protein
MDTDTFTGLALRVLAREATEEERRALDAEMSSHPEYREKFGQLGGAHDLLRAVAPMTGAALAKEPELPVYRLNELRTAVRQHFGPAARRAGAEKKPGWLTPALRWILGSGVVTTLAVVVVLISLSDQSVEVGLYRSDQMRGGETSVAPADVPMARIVTFDQDAPFDQWKKELGWNQHAKIWIDNEKDLLHIVRRDREGHLVEQTEPLAQTSREQSGQIGRAVESVRKR